MTLQAQARCHDAVQSFLAARRATHVKLGQTDDGHVQRSLRGDVFATFFHVIVQSNCFWQKTCKRQNKNKEWWEQSKEFVSLLSSKVKCFDLAKLTRAHVDVQILTERMAHDIISEAHPEPDTSFRLENPRKFVFS